MIMVGRVTATPTAVHTAINAQQHPMQEAAYADVILMTSIPAGRLPCQ
jgi:hypothetical protein